MADLLLFPSPFIDEGLHRPEAAARTEYAPPDAEARARALDIDASWIVEAPAGSGKTGLLMQRMLKLLAFGRVAEPEEVLAITFTRKATAELRERLLKQLFEGAAGKPLPHGAEAFRRETRALAEAVLQRDRELGWGLLERPGRLNVRTIDSLCGEIARTLPLLSGSGGARTPVERAEDLYALAAARTLDQLGGPDAALHEAVRTLLLHRDGSLSDSTALIARMLGMREQWGRLISLAPGPLEDHFLDQEVRPRLERALQEIACSHLTNAVERMPAGLLETLTSIGTRSAELPGHNGQLSPLRLCRERAQPPGVNAEDLEYWAALLHLALTKEGSWRRRLRPNDLGFAPSGPDLLLLQELIESCRENEPLRKALCAVRTLPPAHYPEDQWVVAKALFRLLRHAMAELKLLFAERGQCDFTELALAAREALSSASGSADLAEAAGTRLRHLLVDEVQDTSSFQYELLGLLTRHWGGEGETLFLVGDPRQSIYLFRQARVERFLRTVREGRLGTIRLQSLQLTANFRSQASLVAGFNRTFHAVFQSDSEQRSGTETRETRAASLGMNAPFTAAVPIRRSTPRAKLTWHARVLQDASADGLATDPSASSEEAGLLRRIVEQWQARPLPRGRTEPWRIAVLARAREHLSAILAEFNRAVDGKKVRYRAVAIDPLGSRPEILDLLALTRALLHPADRVAWLAVLHAPWCGLGRADLLSLAGEGPDSDPRDLIPVLLEARAHLLSPVGQALLARVAPTLKTAMQSLGRLPLSVQVERTWRSLGGDATLRPEALTNTLNFFAVLRELEAEHAGQIALSALMRRLKFLYAEPQVDTEAVEIMTIHNSKGLEWDVVLVPGLERQPRMAESELLNWLELDGESDKAAHVVLAPIHGKGEDSDKLNAWMQSVRQAREEAEAKRLLYVACTRAREELHLFASATRKNDGTLKSPAHGSLLRAGWPAAEAHFHPASPSVSDRNTPKPSLLFDWLESHHDEMDDGLALAASAETPASFGSPGAPPPVVSPQKELLHRLPLSFKPLDRFVRSAEQRLPYGQPVGWDRAALFERPEGSFAVRAFGNVVHRFLGQIAAQLARGKSLAEMQAEIPAWSGRVEASLRAEGLSPSLVAQQMPRATAALLRAATDEQGQWVLSPHSGAADECSLAASSTQTGLRVDRMFLAGSAPLSSGEEAIWIIDFKTSEPGGRDVTDFLSAERLKYQPQLEAYAAARRSLPGGHLPIHLALYYPLMPALVHWRSEGEADLEADHGAGQKAK